MNDERVPLSKVLDLVTSEILLAHKNATAAGHQPVMKFEGCELEFGIDVEAKAEGGFHVWVMKLGGGVKRTESNTIKIRYTALVGAPQPGQLVAAVEGPPGAVAKPARAGEKEE